MHKYAVPLLGGAFLILGICFLCALSCSWRIFSEGEIQKETAEISEVIEFLPSPIVRILRIEEGTDSDPDSIWFNTYGTVRVDSTLYDFVEMEVGELLEGQGWERDTILTDHVPSNE